MSISGNINNVDQELLRRLGAWNSALKNKYAVHIGWRSNADQLVAYNKYLAGTGPVAAKPGTSKHNQSPSLAVDLRGADSYTAGSGHTTYSERVLGAKYGLCWPVGQRAAGGGAYDTTEPWHVEKITNWSGTFPVSITGTGWTNLHIGSTGTAVKKWQTWLHAMFGYASRVNPDGKFGPITESATKEFQSRVGYKGDDIDGNVGPGTLAKAVALGFKP